jgi:hypothetical protein
MGTDWPTEPGFYLAKDAVTENCGLIVEIFGKAPFLVAKAHSLGLRREERSERVSPHEDPQIRFLGRLVPAGEPLPPLPHVRRGDPVSASGHNALIDRLNELNVRVR